jgi:hypothetical protein
MDCKVLQMRAPRYSSTARNLGRDKSSVPPITSESIASDTQSHLDRCKKELEEIHNMGEQELWLTALGEADWEAERHLILKEAGEPC